MSRRSSANSQLAAPRSSAMARLYAHQEASTGPPVVPARFARLVADADITIDHLTALMLWVVGGGMATLTLSIVAGIAHALAFWLGVLVIPLALANRWRGRRTRRLIADLPDLVDLVGRSLRSGATVNQAIAEAVANGPQTVGRELAPVVSGLANGQDASDAMQAWVGRVPVPEVRIVAAALTLASRTEAGTAQALAGVSQSLRDRAALEAEVRSHSAQAGASMQTLLGLPALFLLFDFVGSQRTVRFLTGHPVGQGCFLAAAVLNLVGWWWMTSLIRRQSPK